MGESSVSGGLLTHVSVSKYQDAPPLHRQEAMLTRSGVERPRYAVANWMIKAGELFQPLLNLVNDTLLAYPVMHCDETRALILLEPDKAATSTSYLWVRVGGLYTIEKQIKDLLAENKRARRQQASVPQLQKIPAWLDKTLHSMVPKGLLGKALSYLNKNWLKLTIHTHDGRLSIDNNPAENAIRPFVIGRKNWLFSASVKGAHASANLYSLIETAKANKREPYQYLREVFAKLPGAAMIDDVEALLLWNVTLQGGAG